MCRSVTCRRCGKTTWAGCGMHVDQVMRGVARDQRCSCDIADAAKSQAAEPSRPGWRSLFRR